MRNELLVAFTLYSNDLDNAPEAFILPLYCFFVLDTICLFLKRERYRVLVLVAPKAIRDSFRTCVPNKPNSFDVLTNGTLVLCCYVKRCSDTSKVVFKPVVKRVALYLLVNGHGVICISQKNRVSVRYHP